MSDTKTPGDDSALMLLDARALVAEMQGAISELERRLAQSEVRISVNKSKLLKD